MKVWNTQHAHWDSTGAGGANRVSLSVRLPVVPAGEAASNRQPAAGQRQTDGLPATTERLQDGHPVCVLTEYVCSSQAANEMKTVPRRPKKWICQHSSRSSRGRGEGKSSRRGDRLRQTQPGVQRLPGRRAELHGGEWRRILHQTVTRWMCDVELMYFVFVGDGVGSKSRQRSSETSSQDPGGHRPVRHVHARPVVFHGEKGTHTNAPPVVGPLAGGQGYSHCVCLCVSVRAQGVSHKFVIAVLMEYIRSLNQFQITVQVKPSRVTVFHNKSLCLL